MPPPPAPPMADQPESHPGFSSIQVPDLVAMVEAQLQDAILEGRIALGERIVEADLARRMGISRAPVREAARRLESTGLLVARPRHGFAVRDFTLQQVDDLYQVRITLEGMGARLACRHATDSDCAALLDQVGQMVAQAARLSRARRVAQDLAFHHQLCALSGNAYLLKLFQNLRHEVQLFLALSEDSYGDPTALAETHWPIAQALQRRDEAGLVQALRHHLEVAVVHVRQLFTQHSAR